MNATQVWINQLSKLMLCPTIRIRGSNVKESISDRVVVDMNEPYVRHPGRKISDAFRYAEAYWILSGSNRVSGIEPYAPSIAHFSDNGAVFQGAYGPKITEQLMYIGECLDTDPHSRQAVINIWRENPRASKDVPCTLSLQFLVRENELHVIANMRSSDIWLGLPYDIFNFTCVANYVRLVWHQPRLQLGTLTVNMGSSHLYERNIAPAKTALEGPQPGDIDVELFGPDLMPRHDNEIQFMQWLKNSRDNAHG